MSHPEFTLQGTTTGRLSSTSGPNIANGPKREGYVFAKDNTVIQRINGQMHWTHLEGDKYVVCGVYPRNGRRFPATTYPSWGQAAAVNIWKGSKWLLRNGKRHLIQRVTN